MGADVTTRLVEFATETRYAEIPKEVVEYTKYLTLKTVAGMLAGSAKPSGRKLAALIRHRRLPEEVGVMGCGFKTSLWEAILLQAFFAHASELEDDRMAQGVSWDITVVPLLFPLAEKLRLSGKALTGALAVGLEVHARTCLFSARHLGVTLVPGAAGPAVAAARALGLDAKETASALGLALSGVPLSFVNFGTDGHYFESSLHSLQGIIAAEMAKEGMSGNPDIGAYLSSFLGEERVSPQRIVEDLGTRWVLSEICIKKYPCCFKTHRQIDALIGLRKEHNLSYEQVKAIEVHISPVDVVCDRPEPKTEGDLQFSFQHILGVAMLNGDVTLDHFTDDAIVDPRFGEARSKVKVVVHPDWSVEGYATPARLTVKTQDGKELSTERMYPIGSPQEPLTTAQLRELYPKFTRGILSEQQITRTAEAILNLEKLSDVEELIDMLTFRHKSWREPDSK